MRGFHQGTMSYVLCRYSLPVGAVRQGARFRGSTRLQYLGSSAHVRQLKIAYNTVVSLYDPEVPR